MPLPYLKTFIAIDETPRCRSASLKLAETAEVQVQMADRIAGESYLNVKASMRYMTHMFFSVLFIQYFR